jgi:hypothetical protein
MFFSRCSSSSLLPFQARRSLRKVRDYSIDVGLFIRVSLLLKIVCSSTILPHYQGSTPRSLPFLWSDHSSFRWRNISGMYAMMIPPRSSLLQKIFLIQNRQKRRDGSTKIKDVFFEQHLNFRRSQKLACLPPSKKL